MGGLCGVRPNQTLLYEMSAKRTERRMFEERIFRHHTQLCFLLFLLIGSAMSLAQEPASEKEKEKSGGNTAVASKLISVTGLVRCDQPDPAYAIEVPDRPGHALRLAKRKCKWSEPMVVMGAKSKDGVAIEFPEQMEGKLHTHGFEVDSYDNGEKVTWQNMGTVDGEKGPAAVKGRWSLMRGTGKFKGIKGGGTYEGKLGADDILTLEFEGVYDPSDMEAGKEMGRKK